jgi:hypothetical protein
MTKILEALGAMGTHLFKWQLLSFTVDALINQSCLLPFSKGSGHYLSFIRLYINYSCSVSCCY